MRLNLKHYIVALASIVAFASCEKNETITYDGPAIAHFAGISKDGLYIQDTKTPIDTIWVGVSVKANVERTIPYTVDAKATTAVAGTHYEILTPKVVVPANSSLGYIAVKGNYANLKAHYAVDNAEHLTLKFILNEGGDIPLAQFNTTITAGIFDYVPFVPSEWVGDYSVTIYQASNGALVAENVPFTWTLEDAGSMLFSTTSLYGTSDDLKEAPNFGGKIVMKVDISDPSQFTIRFDDIYLGNHSTYGAMNLKTYPKINEVNTKKGEVILYYSKSVSAGRFYYYKMVFQKK